jgi:hypothetical protein
MAVLCPIAHSFGGSEVIYKARDTEYMFERHDKNSSFLCFW